VAIPAPTESFHPNTPSSPLSTIPTIRNHQITSTSAAQPGTAPSPHVSVGAAIAVITAKQTLECGQGCCKPTTTARDVSDSDGTQEKTVSLVLFHLKMSFSTDIANNLIEKT
jgi:hypothetical protein